MAKTKVSAKTPADEESDASFTSPPSEDVTLVWRDARALAAKRDVMTARLKAAKSALKWAQEIRANHESQRDRVKALFQSQSAPARDLDAAEFTVLSSRADEDDAQIRVEIVKASLLRVCALATYAEARLQEIQSGLSDRDKSRLTALDTSFKKSTAEFA